MSNIRIDKWLWAARFFKTRGLAKQSIEKGRVALNGKRVKPAQSIAIDDHLEIRRGDDIRCVIVHELNTQRGPASRAQQMYEETSESIQAREAAAEQRRLERSAKQFGVRRPEARERRHIRKFKRD